MMRRLTTDLGDDAGRPYFLWDEDVSVAELRQVLDGPDSWERDRLLEEAAGDPALIFQQSSAGSAGGEVRLDLQLLLGEELSIEKASQEGAQRVAAQGAPPSSWRAARRRSASGPKRGASRVLRR